MANHAAVYCKPRLWPAFGFHVERIGRHHRSAGFHDLYSDVSIAPATVKRSSRETARRGEIIASGFRWFLFTRPKIRVAHALRIVGLEDK